MSMVPVMRGELIPVTSMGPSASVLTPLGREMVDSSRGLAYKVVLAMPGTNRHNYEQRVSMALEALVRAVQYYNPNLGFKFSTYACAVIKKHVGRQLKRQFAEWMLTFGPDDPPCDPPMWDDAPEARDDRRLRLDRLRRTLDQLPARIRLVLEGRMCGESLQSIGDRIGVTKERVRQLEGWGKRRIKADLEEAEIRDMGRSARLPARPGGAR